MAEFITHVYSRSNGRKLVSRNLAVLQVGRPRARDYYDLSRVIVEICQQIVVKDAELAAHPVCV